MWAERLSGVDALVSLALRDASGPVAELAGDAAHYAASTIKLAVLGAYLASGRGGELAVHAGFASRVGGRFELSRADDQDDATWAALGSTVPVDVLVARMIQDSSNIATDLVAECITLDAVTAFLTAGGLERSLRLGRLIGDAAAQAAGITNTVTASGLAELMARFAGWIDTPDAGPGIDAALGILAGQKHRDLIPAGLPEGTWTASKSGWVPGVRHDVALVRPVGAPEYVLAVCTTSSPDADASALVRDLSRITFEHWR